MLAVSASFTLFVLLAVVVPGVALQRALRLRADPLLVLPLGLVACAAGYGASLWAQTAWLFPATLALLVVVAALRGAGPYWAAGPPWRGALALALALVSFLALTAYRFNRFTPDGSFALDPLERIDTAFQVGLAWELSHAYPPQVPGLAGCTLSYHLGQHLVRAAAVRHAGISPYDLLSRCDVTLCGLALVLAFYGLAWQLGARHAGLLVAGLAPLLADASFVAGWFADADWWTDLFSANLHLSLTFGNSLVPALALLAGFGIALCRFEQEGARGWLVLAALLALAVPFFKIFLAWQLLAGLLLALGLTRRARLLVVAAPLAAMCLGLTLGPGGHGTQITFEPLAAVRRTLLALGFEGGDGLWLLFLGGLWLASAVGARALGLVALVRALRGRASVPLSLAGLVLSGLPPALLLRITIRGEGADYNEAVYFITGGLAVLWIFTAVELDSLRHRALVTACVLALALPTSAHFIVRRLRTTPESVPAHVLRLVARLRDDSRPGDVVLSPTSPRWPPPALVFAGRRVPWTRFLPYLVQYAPRDVFEQRRALVQEFFSTPDAARALDRRAVACHPRAALRSAAPGLRAGRRVRDAGRGRRRAPVPCARRRGALTAASGASREDGQDLCELLSRAPLERRALRFGLGAERGIFDLGEVDAHVASGAPDAGLERLGTDLEVGTRGQVAVGRHLHERCPTAIGGAHGGKGHGHGLAQTRLHGPAPGLDLLGRGLGQTQRRHVVVEGRGVGVDHGNQRQHGLVQRRDELAHDGVLGLELALAVSHPAHHRAQGRAQRRHQRRGRAAAGGGRA